MLRHAPPRIKARQDQLGFHTALRQVAQFEAGAGRTAARLGEAGEWGGDAQRFILMGHSAGAHLVALLAAMPRPAYAPDLQPVLGTVALDSAAMNVVEIMSQKHYRLYDKPFGSDPAYWRSMSPTLNLAAGAAPLLAVGCADGLGLSRPRTWNPERHSLSISAFAALSDTSPARQGLQAAPRAD